jgi:F0F1-type ATP synthase membrane subunit a
MSLFLHPVFAEEGVPPAPVPLFSLDGFEINNSMIAEALACIIIVTIGQTAMRAPKLIPSGLQNFVEWLVEMLSNFIESLAGRETMERGFWFFSAAPMPTSTLPPPIPPSTFSCISTGATAKRA